MPAYVRCQSCGHLTNAPQESTDDLKCPYCGKTIEVTTADSAQSTSNDTLGRQPDDDASYQPDGATVAPKKGVLHRMFQSLLDPRSIHWMLLIGGGLCVLGLIVWLISLGVFKDPRVLAVALGLGTLAILGSGWFLTLRTRYRLAGQALTFLGCVLAPLNLWFYHAQGLVTVDGHLWVGGVICCLLYAATVVILRDSLFMYAFEAGITLTMLLLLGDMGKITDTTWLSLFFMAIGLVSIHCERMFSPALDSDFPRHRFGLPLFWSGHVQIAAALLTLLGSQLLAWMVEPVRELVGLEWAGNLLTSNYLLAAGIWLAGMYAYLYSDIVVRRIGVYLALSGVCLVMAEITLLLGFDVRVEWILAALAVTSVTINFIGRQWPGLYPSIDRCVQPLVLLLGFIPAFWGFVLHVRATSVSATQLSWSYATGAEFVVVMFITAVANCVNAYLYRRSEQKASTIYFFISGASVLIAASGLLRLFGLVQWTDQAPWMMLVPFGYLIASRLRRNHDEEWPLYWVAQSVTLIILLHVFNSAIGDLRLLAPLAGQQLSLMLSVSLAVAAAFYFIAGLFHPRTGNTYLGTIVACGALWQLLGYWGVDDRSYTMLYAALGLACLVASRALGDEPNLSGSNHSSLKDSVARGRGIHIFQCGNGILGIACLATLFQGLAGLATRSGSWLDILTMFATAGTAALAAFVVPARNWRRIYTTAAISIGAVTFMRLSLLSQLSGWQKLELFCVTIGVAMLIAGHIGLFRESHGKRHEGVGVGLGLGSILVSAALTIAVFYHRWLVGRPSTIDEIALLTLTIPMLITGLSWKVKATTLCGGLALTTYLVALVISLAYRPEVAIGIYLAIGGAFVFAIGIILSIYRDRLLEIPDHVANRTGVFRILNWR